MRKSRSITLTVLAGLMLTGCCLTSYGCGGRRPPPPPDHSWYDAHGNRIEQRWKTDEHGKPAVDEQGRPIPDPHVPYDNYGRPWVYTNGAWAPLPVPVTASRSSSGWWLWGGSGYRSTGGSSYRPSGGSGSSTISPSRSSASPSSSSSSSSISRGGFGSTGAGSSGT